MAKYVFVYDLDTLSHGHTCAVQEKAKNTPEISCALALCHNTDGSTTTMQANSPWDSMLHRPRNGFFFFFSSRRSSIYVQYFRDTLDLSHGTKFPIVIPF